MACLGQDRCAVGDSPGAEDHFANACAGASLLSVRTYTPDTAYRRRHRSFVEFLQQLGHDRPGRA